MLNFYTLGFNEMQIYIEKQIMLQTFYLRLTRNFIHSISA